MHSFLGRRLKSLFRYLSFYWWIFLWIPHFNLGPFWIWIQVQLKDALLQLYFPGCMIRKKDQNTSNEEDFFFNPWLQDWKKHTRTRTAYQSILNAFLEVPRNDAVILKCHNISLNFSYPISTIHFFSMEVVDTTQPLNSIL